MRTILSFNDVLSIGRRGSAARVLQSILLIILAGNFIMIESFLWIQWISFRTLRGLYSGNRLLFDWVR